MNKKYNIIAVGNGPSVLDKDYGKIIDSYDTVIRFNSYYPAIKRFEKNLGTKTDIWFTVSNVRIVYREVGKIIFHTWENNKKNHPYYKRLLDTFKNKPIDIVTDETIKKARIDFNNYHLISTGLIAIYMMLENKEGIDIVGFDWWDNDYKRLHFYDNYQKNTNNLRKGHCPEKEKNIILSYGDRIHFLKN